MLNEFISFWFQTSVDGVLQYETILDFLGRNWYTCKPEENLPLLKGTWERGLRDDEVIGHIIPFVEVAIISGKI